MKRKFLSISLTILLFSISLLAQDQTENLLEKTELNFALSADADLPDVGFENPKGFWKVKYELFLTDFAELEKLGVCQRDAEGRHICLPIRDKKLNKQIKKKSSKLRAGNFVRKNLSTDSNRNVVVVPISLAPNVIETFNQARKLPEKNPTFVLFVTEKISIKNSSNLKLKQKNSRIGINNLKNAMSNQNFEYWNISCLSVRSSVAKLGDKLTLQSNPINSGCPTN